MNPTCPKHGEEMYPVLVERFDHDGESLGMELDNYVCGECEHEAVIVYNSEDIDRWRIDDDPPVIGPVWPDVEGQDQI